MSARNAVAFYCQTNACFNVPHFLTLLLGKLTIIMNKLMFYDMQRYNLFIMNKKIKLNINKNC